MSYNRKCPATIIRVDGEICNGRHSDAVNAKDVWYSRDRLGFIDEPSLNLTLGKQSVNLFINSIANPYKV